MSEFSYNSGLLTNYLLGELPQAEQDRFEEEYFCDNELFIALLDAKDQLISDYLDGKLSDTERQRFERHFLTSPDCKREVELASFLRPKRQIETARPILDSKPSWWQTMFRFVEGYKPQIGLMTAMLIIGAVVSWQMMRRSPGPDSLNVGQSVDQIPAGQIIVPLSLKPSFRRSSSQETTARVGRETQTIDLNFEVGNEDFQNYQGSLRNKQDGVEILSDSSLKAVKNEDGIPIVNWQVPAAQLHEGDYTVILKGIAPDGSGSRIGSEYPFEIRYLQPENSQPSK